MAKHKRKEKKKIEILGKWQNRTKKNQWRKKVRMKRQIKDKRVKYKRKERKRIEITCKWKKKKEGNDQ